MGRYGSVRPFGARPSPTPHCFSPPAPSWWWRRVLPTSGRVIRWQRPPASGLSARRGVGGSSSVWGSATTHSSRPEDIATNDRLRPWVPTSMRWTRPSMTPRHGSDRHGAGTRGTRTAHDGLGRRAGRRRPSIPGPTRTHAPSTPNPRSHQVAVPEVAVVAEPDPAEARRIARKHLGTYLRLENYHRSLSRLGYGEDDLSGGGSDRLVDALVGWGTLEQVARRVGEHLDAGADHVAVQVLSEDPARLPLDEWRSLAGILLR